MLEEDIGRRGCDSGTDYVVSQKILNSVLEDRDVEQPCEEDMRMTKDEEAVKMSSVDDSSGDGGGEKCVMKLGYCTLHELKGKRIEVSSGSGRRLRRGVMFGLLPNKLNGSVPGHLSRILLQNIQTSL